MILQGYAGTGKTSIVSALVKTLPLFNYKYLLLAPTGRAAKVLSSYTEKAAFTIHKIIYKQVADPKSGQLKFRRVKNHYPITHIYAESQYLNDNDLIQIHYILHF